MECKIFIVLCFIGLAAIIAIMLWMMRNDIVGAIREVKKAAHDETEAELHRKKPTPGEIYAAILEIERKNPDAWGKKDKDE